MTTPSPITSNRGRDGRPPGVVGERRAPGRGRTGPVLAVAVLAVLYAALQLALPADVFWSPDEGAKLLQMRGYVWHSGLQQRVPYGGRRADPRYRYYPRPLPPHHRFEILGTLYPQPTASEEVVNNWPALFPLLSLLPFSILGVRGLYLLPAAAGLATALLAGRMARRITPDAEVPVILTVGLATPILVYSMLFWEHTLAVLLVMGATCVVVSRERPGVARWAVVLLLLAIAVALRPEMTVAAAALAGALACVWAWERTATGSGTLRTILVAAGGSAVLAAVALLSATSIAGAGGLLRLFGANKDSLGRLLLGLLRWRGLWAQLPQRLERALVDLPAGAGPHVPPILACLAVLGFLGAVAALALKEPARSWAMAIGGGLVTGASAWVVVSPDRFRAVSALLLPAPYLAFTALLLPVRRDTPRARKVLGIMVVLMLAAAVVLSLPLLTGGLEWGSRYQLVAYTLGAVACTSGLVLYRKDDARGPARAAVTAGVVLALVVGSLFQLRGAREVLLTKSHLEAYRRLLVTAGAPVVTDLYWLPGSLPDVFSEYPVFTLADPSDLDDWLRTVGAGGGRFRLVTDLASVADLERWLGGGRRSRLRVVADRNVAGIRFIDLRAEEPPRVEGRR